jgi:hypothetical protein
MGMLRSIGRDLERRWDYWMHDSGRRRRMVGKAGPVGVGLLTLCCFFGGCVSFGTSGSRGQQAPAAVIVAPTSEPAAEPAETEANSLRASLVP